MRKMIATINACALLAGAPYVFAQDQLQSGQSQLGQSPQAQSSAAEAGAIISGSATVEKVNKNSRELTLKRDDGSTVTVKVPESVRNFDQIKQGDTVNAKYSESIALSVRKSDEPPSAIEEQTLKRAPLGARPAGEVSNTTQISATIENIDRNTREVTLQKPDGSTTKIKVPQDVQKFDQLKKGDQVVVTATESLAMDVTPK